MKYLFSRMWGSVQNFPETWKNDRILREMVIELGARIVLMFVVIGILNIPGLLPHVMVSGRDIAPIIGGGIAGAIILGTMRSRYNRY